MNPEIDKCEDCGNLIINCDCGAYGHEELPKCPECGGSGLTIESMDCDFCDGLGYLEI